MEPLGLVLASNFMFFTNTTKLVRRERHGLTADRTDYTLQSRAHEPIQSWLKRLKQGLVNVSL